MADHTDYDTDLDSDLVLAHRERRSEQDWDDVWNSDDRNRETLHKIELGLAVIAAGVAFVIVRAGWLRMTSRPKHVVPSAADPALNIPPRIRFNVVTKATAGAQAGSRFRYYAADRSAS
jgi:hypothetical protein